jgi:hypothetical protein
MHFDMIKPCLIVVLGLSLLHAVAAQDLGVISDPDGFTNLRKEQDANSAVVARVKDGEVFEFESKEGAEWWEVTLASGKSGWMHRSRIRLHYTLDEMPEKDEEGDEVSYYGKAHGFDYSATARAAVHGEPAAMKRFFGIDDMDGGAAETHWAVFRQVIHLLGDEKLTAFLKDQPLSYKLHVRNELFSDFALWSLEEGAYLKRNFPQTSRLLFREQIVDWPSPDGRFRIRKMFSDPRPTEKSKVVKAEVIEKASGKVIAELTDDDIGTGLHREGKVLWSPDSQRFAYMSGALGAGGEAQTVVYQKRGGTFIRAELPDAEFPGRATDAELKGAKHLWTFVEPQCWEQPDVLLLLHHQYFESKRADHSIQSIGRTYDIRRNLTTGKATVKVKPIGD